MSFDPLKNKYDLPNCHFYGYLQLRHFVNLRTNISQRKSVLSDLDKLLKNTSQYQPYKFSLLFLLYLVTQELSKQTGPLIYFTRYAPAAMVSDSKEYYKIFGYYKVVQKKNFLKLGGFECMTEILVIEFFKLSNYCWKSITNYNFHSPNATSCICS